MSSTSLLWVVKSWESVLKSLLTNPDCTVNLRFLKDLGCHAANNQSRRATAITITLMFSLYGANFSALADDSSSESQSANSGSSVPNTAKTHGASTGSADPSAGKEKTTGSVPVQKAQPATTAKTAAGARKSASAGQVGTEQTQSSVGKSLASKTIAAGGAVTLHEPIQDDTPPKTVVVGNEIVNPDAAWNAALGDTKTLMAKIGPGVSTTQPSMLAALRNAQGTSVRSIAQAASVPNTSTNASTNTNTKNGTSQGVNSPAANGGNTSIGGPSNSVQSQNPAAPGGLHAPSINDPNRGMFTAPPVSGGQPAGINANAATNQPSTGETAKPPSIPSAQFSQDKLLFDKENDEWRQRYLIGEAIELSLPQPSQLISLGAKLPPIRLEANYTQPISLKDSLLYSLDNNLAIRIANANKSAQKWLTVGQFGNFLPNMIMNFQHQFLKGASLIGGVIPTTFDTPNTTAQAGFQMFGFQGGAVLFGTLSQLHQFRAAREQLHGTVNDTLLAVTRGYYNLVQNQALLQIQTRAVEVSRAQVVLNQQLEQAGTGTKFQVLQSDTQLARDEQNLLGQEVALRNSAIDLATTLNLNAAVNFLSVETEIRKVRLIDPSLDINTLVSLAVLNRPELRQYESLRVAARRNIQVAAAPLYPQFQFFGSVNGNGATLGHSTTESKPSFTTVAVNAPSSSSTIVSPNPNIVGNGSSTLVASGTTQDVFSQAAGAGASNKQPLVAAAEQYNAPTAVSRQMRKSYTIGLRVDWNYPGLGVPTVASVWAAKALARQALLNSNQQLLNVLQQVRESYLLSQTAEREIEVTTKAVISAAEELRLSRVRLANGVGTNIDVINSQRDFTTALVNKAQAIIQFNIAQAQLLHDIGLITVDTLTSGRLAKRDST